MDVMGRWLDIFTAIWTLAAGQMFPGSLYQFVVDSQHYKHYKHYSPQSQQCHPDIWSPNRQPKLCQRLVREMTTQFLYQYQQREAEALTLRSKGFSSVLSFFNMSEDFAQ